MGMLILEAIGSEGESLAMRASELTEVPVGWDGDEACATFDSADLDDAELEGIIFDALNGLDPSWSDHLRLAE